MATAAAKYSDTAKGPVGLCPERAAGVAVQHMIRTAQKGLRNDPHKHVPDV